MKGYIYKYKFPNVEVHIGQTRCSPDERHREYSAEEFGKVNSNFLGAYHKHQSLSHKSNKYQQPV